ncbi:hypothetical protein STEG23_007069, partial [Scotinomys teguina]
EKRSSLKHGMATQNNRRDLCGDRGMEGENNRLLRQLLFLVQDMQGEFCPRGSGARPLPLTMLK